MSGLILPVTGDPETDAYIKKKLIEDDKLPPASTPVLPKGEPIVQFRGEYRWLSNFFECRIVALDRTFNSTEAAYQAAKRVDDKAFHEKISRMGPKEAMHYGRSLPVTTPDWHVLTKFQVMRILVEQKFMNHQYLARLLLGTGERHLEEGNTWGDKVWGTDLNDKLHPLVADIMEVIHNGENRLGKILMDTRRGIRMGTIIEPVVKTREYFDGAAYES